MSALVIPFPKPRHQASRGVRPIPAPISRRPRWCELSNHTRARWLDFLDQAPGMTDAFERRLLDSLAEQLNRTGRLLLSERQIERVERMIEHAWRSGVRL